MTWDAAGAAAVGVALGGLVAWGVVRVRLAAAPERLVRTNYAGARVPAVLGDGVIVGSLSALGLLGAAGATGLETAAPGRVGAAVAVVIGIMGAAGRLDDLRGPETARGFSGHLRAAVRGQLTGGSLKILAGGLAGLAAGAIVSSGIDVLTIGILVALGANTVNLFDRAPGRAGKVWLLAAAPLFIWGSADWAVAASGVAGALLAVLPADLGARGMLGDTGANPLGAVWGLGLASATGDVGRLLAIAALVVLNGASERWSFSRVIERTPLLRGLDHLGRK